MYIIRIDPTDLRSRTPDLPNFETPNLARGSPKLSRCAPSSIPIRGPDVHLSLPYLVLHASRAPWANHHSCNYISNGMVTYDTCLVEKGKKKWVKSTKKCFLFRKFDLSAARSASLRVSECRHHAAEFGQNMSRANRTSIVKVAHKTLKGQEV